MKTPPWYLAHPLWGLLVVGVALLPIPMCFKAWLASAAVGIAHEWGDAGRQGDLFLNFRVGIRDAAFFTIPATVWVLLWWVV